MRKITCFKPDNVLLRYFTEDFGRQYLAKRERPSREQIGLTFGYKSKTLPKLTLLNSNAQNWFISEVNPSRDSLRYWITDSSVIKMDTLLIQLDYLKTDSVNLLSPRTDTLKLISRTQHLAAKSPNAKKSKKDDANKPIPVVHLDARINLPAKLDVNAVPVIEWEAPVRTTYGDPWHLYKKKDTTWVRVPFKIDKDTTFLRRYNLIAKWEFGGEYKLDLDSGKVESLYGLTNDKVSKTFRVKEEEEYSRLILTVNGLNGPGFVELLDKSDKPVRKEPLVNHVADFKYLSPGTYYLRAVEDLNKNFKWDAGDYTAKRQPEYVYYRPVSVSLRENWDVEETWIQLICTWEHWQTQQLYRSGAPLIRTPASRAYFSRHPINCRSICLADHVHVNLCRTECLA